MKVKLENNYKKLYTIYDIQKAKHVIAEMADYDEKPEDILRHAVTYMFGEYVEEVLTANAYTSKNFRVSNLYGPESEDMDVFVKGVVMTYNKVYEIGVYASDIWDYDNAETLRRYSYVRTFKEC